MTSKTAILAAAVGSLFALAGPVFAADDANMEKCYGVAIQMKFILTLANDISHETYQANVLAYWSDGSFREPFAYSLAGTPCECVLDNQIVAFPRNISEMFPKDREWFASLGAQSFLAIPLCSEDGRVRGHLAVLDSRERDWGEVDLGILKIFSTRAGAELERRDYEKRLETTNTAVTPDTALGLEWLVTNGLGGFACGTVSLANTRRYHGLLVASLHPPVDRVLMVAKADVTVRYREQQFELATNEYGDGTLAPRGFEYLNTFHLDNGLPVWTYALGDALLEQRIWMANGRNTTYVSWLLRHATEEMHVTVLPLCTYRDYHSQAQGGWPLCVERQAHTSLVSSSLTHLGQAALGWQEAFIARDPDAHTALIAGTLERAAGGPHGKDAGTPSLEK
jgi:hypothetical protein